MPAVFGPDAASSRGIASPDAERPLQLKQSRKQRNATSSAKGRQGNEVYRVREYLTEAEIEKLLTALRQNRYGHRDWLIGLLIYRHGLRVSEACDLRWDDIDLTSAFRVQTARERLLWELGIGRGSAPRADRSFGALQER